MGEPVAVGSVIVSNPQGLHARPAEMFVKLAGQFEAKVEVLKDCECVDGKSILGILTLFAEQGTELIIRATGEDAAEALKALSELVESGFCEDRVSDEA